MARRVQRSNGAPVKLVYIATDGMTAYRLMDGQLRHMQEHGFDVTVITSPGDLLNRVAEREGVRAIGVPMQRAIALRQDALSLGHLTLVLRRIRPDIVFAGTTKAGLLGVSAARLAGVPVVVYHLRGLRYESERGLKRAALMLTEHVSGRMAHWVFCNGESLRDEFVRQGFGRREKTWIPANGSSNGVDIGRFRSDRETQEWARAERQRLGIAPAALVVGFVGRFTRDKGLEELLQALQQLWTEGRDLHLLAVGDFDGTDPLPEHVISELRSNPRVTITGFVREPERYYFMMDVFAFPSHREGFPNAPLEASAAKLPIVAFRATGTVDAVVHGETGMLVELGDVNGFAQALRSYLSDPELRLRHGEAGRSRTHTKFSRPTVWAALVDKFKALGSGGDEAPSRSRAN